MPWVWCMAWRHPLYRSRSCAFALCYATVSASMPAAWHNAVNMRPRLIGSTRLAEALTISTSVML